MIDALSEAPVTYRMRGSFYKQAGGNVQRHGVFQRFQFVFQTGNHFQKKKESKLLRLSSFVEIRFFFGSTINCKVQLFLNCSEDSACM